MGALTMPRKTPQWADGMFPNEMTAKMASGATIFVGALVVGQNVGTGSSMRAKGGLVATGLRALGIMDSQPHLLPLASYTSTQDGIPAIQIRRGTFKLDIDPNDPVTEQDIGRAVYIASDHEISKTPGGNARSICGTLMQIDYAGDPTGPGAWVAIGVLPTTGFPLPTGVSLP
jgi:hypothetical protein